MNRDNLLNRVPRIYLQEGTAKNGNPWARMHIEFMMPTGESYDFTTDFLTNEQRALLTLSVPLDDSALDSDS